MFVEQIFVMLILSYIGVLILALVLLKKDLQKSLSNVFRFRGRSITVVGAAFTLLYLGLWYLISFVAGSRFELLSFPSLEGYGNYAVSSPFSAFLLQLLFVSIGAFSEEVAYRAYVQTSVSSKYGYVAGILVATLLFSLQHIHIFQLSWIENFFQTQFVHVILFGVFVGYFFHKTNENLWGVTSFHCLLNILSVSIPVLVIATSPFASQFVDIVSFAVMILILKLLFSKKLSHSKQIDK